MTSLYTYQNLSTVTADYAAQTYYTQTAYYDTIQPTAPIEDEKIKPDDIYEIPSVDKIISLALGYEYVLAARAFVYDGNTVVALITTPFYLKSERDGAKSSIKQSLSTDIGNENVIVTFDVEVYRRIRGELEEEEMQKLLLLAKSR